MCVTCRHLLSRCAHFLFFRYSGTIAEPLQKSLGSAALGCTVATVTVCCCDSVRFVGGVKCARLTRNRQFVVLPQVEDKSWLDWKYKRIWKTKSNCQIEHELQCESELASFPLASFPMAAPSFWLMHAGSVMSFFFFFLKTPANKRERRHKRSLEIAALCGNWRALRLCRASQVSVALITACQQSFYLMWFTPNP